MTQVFILAGQSNMEGQAVVDLDGQDYNNGKGTLTTLMKGKAGRQQMRHLVDSQGRWRVRSDVRVWYRPGNAPATVGPLDFGYTVYLDRHHFGPELQFGHAVGDALRDPVLLIKCAWGGKSLYTDFRPPSSGGTTGAYYTRMLEHIDEARTSISGKTQLAGFVWYQGWNDLVDPKFALPEYEANCVNLISDVRKALGEGDLPVAVGELTGGLREGPPELRRLRDAQKAATQHRELGRRISFVPTRDFVRKPEDSPNPTHGHHEYGNAETIFLVGNALGNGILTARSRR